MAKADPTVEIPVDMDFEEKALNIPLGTYVQFVFTLPTVLTFFIFVPWNRTSQGTHERSTKQHAGIAGASWMFTQQTSRQVGITPSRVCNSYLYSALLPLGGRLSGTYKG